MNVPVSVDEVLCTGELKRRAARSADFATENLVLNTLIQALADSPDSILQTMVETMLEIFSVGSAGCSLLVDGDDTRFYWPAIAGAWRAQVGGGTPRDFGPCGDVLDRKGPLLFRQPQRRYLYLRDVVPGIEECLLVPLYVERKSVGTIWLVAHDEARKFDAEDLRLLLSISRFAAPACKAMLFSQRMRDMNEALLLSSLQQHEFAEAEEKLNALLRDEIRVREALEVELKQATRDANQASVSKSDFLANISHELRTPLSAILGHAQVMELDAGLTETQKRSITQIKKGGWYLADLINDILDLAQIEAGQLSVRMESVSLAEVVLECQALMEPLAQPLNVSVSYPCLESPDFVLADRKRIKQVLINLISNAIKYNRKGGTVTVACLRGTPDLIRISVVDTGVGLTETELAGLFQLFNRLGQDVHKVSGTGIGLVMAKRLTELMGGTVGAESTMGEGSTFWIELKRATNPIPVLVQGAAQYLASSAGRDMRKTVLYIEDNPANLIVLQELMSHRPDIRLLSALNGIDGVAVARAELPDAILLDMRLPDVHGLDVAAMLAANPETASIPLIAFTANAMPQDISKAMDAGFFHYLTKPINVDEMMRTLDRALGLTALDC
ncbi:MAG: hypothetical protein RLZZ227_37 [Pseudomonadota bacterium]|jgi:signal transduction histidine kinase/ActR/RegA family two-component response regulator